ncbi:CAMK family protein kinase [Histomonas meleagridis]|uniref:CAMK family protein kinase n=1 Tax=Histomonas meleagridis TaxID=135588 RepID=UPI0035598605|nr:CAMK family protein kinase [Histomonas meleagridis]KAH0797508.1 CAMK family protein kinase [Histomonas meleagridis]
MEEPFPFVLHGYEFQKIIGQGSNSTAFQVYSIKYQRYFCAKMTEVDNDLSCDQPQLQELQALIKLDHPNIIRVYDYFQEGEYYFQILELCEEGSLDDLLKNTGKLDLPTIRKYMRNIVDGLNYCHKRMIAHRDIKPANIFLGKYDKVKIGDFGLCSILSPNHRLVNNSWGSPSYAAPEIYGNQAYDPLKADVWALGVTLYQLYFNKLPWDDSITMKGPKRTPLHLPFDTDLLFCQLLTSMLQIDPNKRKSLDEISNSMFLNPVPKVPTRLSFVYGSRIGRRRSNGDVPIWKQHYKQPISDSESQNDEQIIRFRKTSRVGRNERLLTFSSRA